MPKLNINQDQKTDVKIVNRPKGRKLLWKLVKLIILVARVICNLFKLFDGDGFF